MKSLAHSSGQRQHTPHRSPSLLDAITTEERKHDVVYKILVGGSASRSDGGRVGVSVVSARCCELMIACMRTSARDTLSWLDTSHCYRGTREGMVQHPSCGAFGAPAIPLEVPQLLAAKACSLCGWAGSSSRGMRETTRPWRALSVSMAAAA